MKRGTDDADVDGAQVNRFRLVSVMIMRAILSNQPDDTNPFQPPPAKTLSAQAEGFRRRNITTDLATHHRRRHAQRQHHHQAKPVSLLNPSNIVLDARAPPKHPSTKPPNEPAADPDSPPQKPHSLNTPHRHHG
jgi:hypothetical protein